MRLNQNGVESVVAIESFHTESSGRALEAMGLIGNRNCDHALQGFSSRVFGRFEVGWTTEYGQAEASEVMGVPPF